MKCDKKSLLLYAVTDRTWLTDDTLYEQVEKAIKGGVTFVQLREKKLDEESFLDEALEIQKLCRKYDVPFVINDNVEIAKKINADGVHVGQSDMGVANVRDILGDDKIIGVSVQTVEQAVLAEKQGADYLGVGAVFPTTTKVKTVLTSTETLYDICKAVKIPVCAIGGLNKDNIDILQTATDGVYILTEDIDMSGKDWSPTGEFIGVLDGAGSTAYITLGVARIIKAMKLSCGSYNATDRAGDSRCTISVIVNGGMRF